MCFIVYLYFIFTSDDCTVIHDVLRALLALTVFSPADIVPLLVRTSSTGLVPNHEDTPTVSSSAALAMASPLLTLLVEVVGKLGDAGYSAFAIGQVCGLCKG